VEEEEHQQQHEEEEHQQRVSAVCQLLHSLPSCWYTCTYPALVRTRVQICTRTNALYDTGTYTCTYTCR
jgi:hypothetical protein